MPSFFVRIWVEAELVLVGLVVTMVVVLPFLDVWVTVLWVLPEQTEYYDKNYDEGHHSNDDEPDEGAPISCSHGGGASVEVSDSKGECLGEEEEGEECLDHEEINFMDLTVLNNSK